MGEQQRPLDRQQLGEVLGPVLDLLEHGDQVPVGALQTGLSDLDELTGGMWPGDLWVVTGRPGAGKSVLVLGLARHAAIAQGAPAVVLSDRESAYDVATRVLSAEARVPLRRMRTGALGDDDWHALVSSTLALVDAPLEVISGVGLVEAALRLATPSSEDTRQPGVVVVDGFSLRDEDAGLGRLKALATALLCPVVVVVSDLLGPDYTLEDQAAQAGDLVLRVEDPSGDPQRGMATDLVVTHHRRGPTSRVVVSNDFDCAAFRDLLPRS